MRSVYLGIQCLHTFSEMPEENTIATVSQKKCQGREVVGIKNSIYSTELTSCGSQLSYSVRKTLDLDKLVSPEREHVYSRIQNSSYVE